MCRLLLTRRYVCVDLFFERSPRPGQSFLASYAVKTHIQLLLNIIAVGDVMWHTLSCILYTNP